MCCHREAIAVCVRGTAAVERRGFVLTSGDEEASGVPSVVIVPRLGMNVDSSLDLGVAPKGE